MTDTITRAHRVIGRIEARRELREKMSYPSAKRIRDQQVIDDVKQASYFTKFLPAKVCICCGAPASAVQHD